MATSQESYPTVGFFFIYVNTVMHKILQINIPFLQVSATVVAIEKH
jgi:hypothetical protein